MAEPRQGEIWWATLPEPVGRRPVLVLTRSDAIPALANVSVAPLTRTSRGIPSEVELSPVDGVPTDCAISLENIQTIPKKRLGRPIASLGAAKMRRVFASICFVFAMPET